MEVLKQGKTPQPLKAVFHFVLCSVSLRIIKPKAYHDAIAIDDKITHDLAKVLGNSLLELAESEVIRGAFGENTVGSNSSPSTKNFDPNMIIPVDYKSSPSSTTSVAEKIGFAFATLHGKCGNVDTSELFLALTSGACESLWNDIRMADNGSFQFANIENRSLTHFAGFKIVICDHLPGGKNSPKEFDDEGKMIAKDSIPLKTVSTAPGSKDKVKSYALFWERSGLVTAFWKDVKVALQTHDDRCGAQSMYASFKLGACRSDESRVGYIEIDV
ncbi:hypothetical protein HUT03_03925 [Candidatus Liberibacter africanus]|uniref:phage capsid protein n=1 Tax=Liberibacter africanus TaxID=34020 RepID=UPI001AE1E2B5|nr:phage capsid protein [Candidatus Liberibacter africanus]QTP64134.1 hypothetical protein HUT03_03925 [Candidatus Liberibacter africanus]